MGRWTLLVGMLLGLLVVGGRPLPASAATITDSDCSTATGFSTLQSDISSAGSGDTIRFTCSGTIPFSSTITISKTITLDATGQAVTFDGQGGFYQLFVVSSGDTFGLVGLTFTNGGGGTAGGAILNQGILNITASTFSNNGGRITYEGGAVNNSATLTITASTFFNNNAVSAGGAVASTGTLTITNSTFANNHVTGIGSVGGGALYVHDATINNSTVSGNSVALAGAGGGIYAIGTVTLHADTLANNPRVPGPDCFGPITSTDYNLIDNTSGCTITGTTTHDEDNVPATFQSSSPQNNGGPTPTMLLATTSNGYNYIPLASCGATVDQRDYARGDNGDGTCDIGATETGSTSCVKPTFSSSFNKDTQVLSVTATDNNVGIDSLSVVKSSNATVTIPSSTPGASSVTATVQKVDSTKPAIASFQAINTLGCTADPAASALAVVPGQPLMQTFTDIAQSESQVTIANGRPGLTILVLWVNGKPVVVNGLKAGEQRVVSIASALHAGSNSIKVLGMGPLGSSATVLIGE